MGCFNSPYKNFHSKWKCDFENFSKTLFLGPALDNSYQLLSTVINCYQLLSKSMQSFANFSHKNLNGLNFTVRKFWWNKHYWQNIWMANAWVFIEKQNQKQLQNEKKNISPCQEILSIFWDAATMKCGSFKDHKGFFLKKTSFFENQFLDQTTFWGK